MKKIRPNSLSSTLTREAWGSKVKEVAVSPRTVYNLSYLEPERPNAGSGADVSFSCSDTTVEPLGALQHVKLLRQILVHDVAQPVSREGLLLALLLYLEECVEFVVPHLVRVPRIFL